MSKKQKNELRALICWCALSRFLTRWISTSVFRVHFHNIGDQEEVFGELAQNIHIKLHVTKTTAETHGIHILHPNGLLCKSLIRFWLVCRFEVVIHRSSSSVERLSEPDGLEARASLLLGTVRLEVDTVIWGKNVKPSHVNTCKCLLMILKGHDVSAQTSRLSSFSELVSLTMNEKHQKSTCFIQH